MKLKLTKELAETQITLFQEDTNIPEELKKIKFTAKKDQILYLTGEKLIIAAGLGKNPKPTTIMNATANTCKLATKLGAKQVSITGYDRYGKETAIAAILSEYTFNDYKKEKQEKKDKLDELYIDLTPKEAEEARILAENIKSARQLTNTPAAKANPEYITQIMKQECKKNRLKCDVLGAKQLRQKQMNAILAVGNAGKEPKLVISQYLGAKKQPIIIVGKGITFDSGGLSLKPASSMETMKEDKSGAITAFYTLVTAAQLKLPINLITITPLAENLPGTNALKPGDVITTMSGKTIEVLNTDAEGRVLLSDALTLAAKQEPLAIIDLATLTGACIVALGTTPGIMGNNQQLINDLIISGEKTGEQIWQLPMFEEYDDLVKSDIADVKNVYSNTQRSAGAIEGAKFLEQFAEKKPWAHIDIAGAAWTEKEQGTSSKGATAFGIRLLIEFLKKHAQ